MLTTVIETTSALLRADRAGRVRPGTGGKDGRKRFAPLWLAAALGCLSTTGPACPPASAQALLQQADSALASRYYRAGRLDTAYVVRPTARWTVTARLNVSGADIEALGTDNGRRFRAEMESGRKATLSLGVARLGISLSAALNPARLAGDYSDFELNFNSYGRRFGLDIVCHDSRSFRGWHDHEGAGRIGLPDGVLRVQTLNVNAFYVFNSSRFSYPAAFSQSYIQRRSAGGFLLAVSAMGQRTTVDWEQTIGLKTANVGLGAGYGYNYVPRRGWLLHITALPTVIVGSRASITFGDGSVPLRYHFPETIITGRGAVVRQWGNKFLGVSMVYNFTNTGHEESLALNNTKWRVRTFFGLRLGGK